MFDKMKLNKVAEVFTSDEAEVLKIAITLLPTVIKLENKDLSSIHHQQYCVDTAWELAEKLFDKVK